MGCPGIRIWTFSGLVSVFFDLVFAYVLLCASALAYLASKILGLFGLSLPCPCDGIFGDFDRNICVQRLLVDCPLEKVYSFRSAIKYRTPVAAGLAEREDYGCLGYEDDMYSSSYLDRSFRDKVLEESELRRECSGSSGVMNFSDMEDEKFDSGTTEIESLMPRRNFRCKSQSVPVSGKFLRMSPYESEAQIQCDGDASILTCSRGRDSESYDLHEQVDRTNTVVRGLSTEEQWCDRQGQRGSKSYEKYMINVLEESLKEERAARISLHVELEKERSAAATAADEAMAMILRLQEEKANIEMEARQYRRMVEEKSAYESEEMNILKEILMRREREKHCLENEVEAYGLMISGSGRQGSYGELQGMQSSQEEIAENLTSIVEQFSKTVVAAENVKAKDSRFLSIEAEKCTIPLDKELLFPEAGEDADYWDKWSTNKDRSANKDRLHFSKNSDELDNAADGNEFAGERALWVSPESNYSDSLGHNMDETMFHTEGKAEQNEGSSSQRGLASKAIKINNNQIDIPGNSDFEEKLKEESEDLDSSEFDLEPSFHDVHVIDEAVITHNGASVADNKQSRNCIPKMPSECQSPTLRVIKSCSNMTSGQLLVDHSQGNAVLFDKNRDFMNAVDYERSRIENEVRWLFNRLRILQENRERLNFSAGQNKNDNIPLPVGEDGASSFKNFHQ